jgi:glutathione synthase
MNIAFVLDPLERLDPTGDTSIALIEAAQWRGHDCWFTDISGLALIGGRAHASLRAIWLADGHMEYTKWIAPEPWFRLGPRSSACRDLGDMDAVFIRTDPPMDRRYLSATYILDGVDPARTTMVNEPRGVRNANEKLFPLRFPDLVPHTLVSADAESIRGFVERHGRAVAKPIDGHAGWGVVELRSDDTNLRSLIELATDRGAHPTVVQAWAKAATEGNKRIILFDGEILGAVNRAIEAGDFRTGAPCGVAPITERDREIVDRLTPVLRAGGLRLVGLDVIGDYLIEVNVTSPGGIRQAEGLGLKGMAERLIERLEDTQPRANGARIRAQKRVQDAGEIAAANDMSDLDVIQDLTDLDAMR